MRWAGEVLQALQKPPLPILLGFPWNLLATLHANWLIPFLSNTPIRELRALPSTSPLTPRVPLSPAVCIASLFFKSMLSLRAVIHKLLPAGPPDPLALQTAP